MKEQERYSVLIYAEDTNKQGTGTLVYKQGSGYFYILTCAHVIYGAKCAEIRLLLPDGEDAREYAVRVMEENFHFSPLDQVTELGGNEATHSHDIAVIQCEVGEVPLLPTNFCFYPMKADERIVTHGYPNGNEEECLYYRQETLHGQVYRVSERKPYFPIRLTDTYLNMADRARELVGISGSPVWEESRLEEGKLLFGGLISCGSDTSISRTMVNAMSARALQSFLREELGLELSSEIPGVPETEIAPGYLPGIPGETEDQRIVRVSWVEAQRKSARMLVDMLQLEKAMALCRETIANTEFAKCSPDQQYGIYALLQESHRLAREYDAYREITEQMHSRGITNDREILLEAVRALEADELDKAQEYARRALEINPSGNEERVISATVEAFSDVEADTRVLSAVLGSNDQLLVRPKDSREEESLYQILGFTLIHRFRELDRGIRCLNRAYRVGGNFMVLETLATAYYLYSLRNAYLEPGSDRIDPEKIDIAAIEKARDAYLRVMEAADQRYFAGMIQRTGFQLFKCFHFLQDNFRVYTHYHDLVKYYPFPNQQVLRDVQNCYLRVAIKKDTVVDFSQFQALTDGDMQYFALASKLELAKMERCGAILTPPVPEWEEPFRKFMDTAEEELRAFEKEQPGDARLEELRSCLIDLYGYGVLHYVWSTEPVRTHFGKIQNPKARECLSLYLEELELRDFAVSEKHYQEYFQRYQDIPSFVQWSNFYTRNGRLDKTRELYDTVFQEHRFLIQDQPEYFYREYIALSLRYHFDLLPAIRCFVEQREELKDTVLRRRLEWELKCVAQVYNDPEEMLDTSRMLADVGLLDEMSYRQYALAALMFNLRPEEAEAFADFSHWQNPEQATLFERLLFLWKGAVAETNPAWEPMGRWERCEVEAHYAQDTWQESPEKILGRFRMKERGVIVMDLWAFYYLLKTGQLLFVACFRNIYITHSTVSMALCELNNIEDWVIRQVLSCLLTWNGPDNTSSEIILQSPTLEEQLTIREPEVLHREVHNALLLAEILDCPALIGEFRYPIPERFRHRVLRPDRMLEILSAMGNDPACGV